MKFEIGQKGTFSKKITIEEVRKFAEITGDNNPIHLNEEYAAQSIFKKPIAHGILCSGLISSVIANVLPGEGSIYLGQELKFVAPVYHGDELTAEVEIAEIISEKKQIILNTKVKNQSGTIVINGKARVKNPNMI